MKIHPNMPSNSADTTDSKLIYADILTFLLRRGKNL